jgi:outer membrane protein
MRTNKALVIIISMIGLMFNHVNAQSKFGYVNAAEMLYLMPEMKNVERALDSVEKELGALYQKDMDDYNVLLKKFEQQQKDGASQTLLELTQSDIVAKQEYLSKAQQVYQETLVDEQNKLITPLNEKILKAIKDVATEKGLNYVFDISKGAVLHWDEKDDVSKDVRKKLGISETATLPQNGGK